MTVFRNPAQSAGSLTFFKERHRSWGLEATIFLLVGIVVMAYTESLHSLDVVSETIILVIFLSGLMGITRSIGIPFGIPLFAIPIACGFGSMFMDSFLILLIVSKVKLEGPQSDQFKFKVYATAAALIGGIGTYFGEVYLLPLCLKYGMREWWSTLPLWPPVIVFLGILSYLSGRLQVSIKPSNGGESLTWQDCLEFVFFIGLLLWTKNAIICLAVVIFWSYITGQGEEFIEGVWEIDKAVLGLLLIALLLIHAPQWPLTDGLLNLIDSSTGWWAFIPSGINGVLTGALFPACGDFWKDALILSTSVLFLPISSLVGVMVFKPCEWWMYFKVASPLMLVWFLIAGLWLFGPWDHFFKDKFYAIFKKEPALIQKVEHH